MKTLNTLMLAMAAILTVSAPSFAQSYTISNTTLNGAISASATTLVLTSASASSGSSFGAPAVGQCLVIENETMRITAISSTTVTVQRAAAGGGGNPAIAHANSAVIWTAPCNAFKQTDPTIGTSQGSGQCASQPAPWINLKNGNVWWCNTAKDTWSGTNYAKFTYNSVPVAQ